MATHQAIETKDEKEEDIESNEEWAKETRAKCWSSIATRQLYAPCVHDFQAMFPE
jgi:hypothetical protein